MGYIKDTLQYYFKNILYILLLASIPALFVGLLLKPFSIFEFIYAYPTLTLETFRDFFLNIYSFTWLGGLMDLIGFVIMIVATSYLLGHIEAHFRVGKVDFSLHNRNLNNNLSSVFWIFLIMIVLYFVINILLMLLMFFVHFLFSVNGIGTIAGAIVNYIVILLGIMALSRVTTLLGLTCVDIMIMGSPFTVALSNASHAIGKHPWRVFLAENLPFVFVFVLTLLGSWIHLTLLTNVLSILFIFPYICILTMVIFFEHNSLKRYDNRKYYYLR